MYDRLCEAACRRPRLLPSLLAHVITHEMAHAMEALDDHSDNGIMKAHWTRADYDQMENAPLPFTSWDVSLIQQGFASRRNVLVSSLLIWTFGLWNTAAPAQNTWVYTSRPAR